MEIASGSRPVKPHHQLVAPNAIRSEALNLLLARVRAGELTDKAALRLLERLTEVTRRLLGDRVARRTAWEVVRERGWPTVDSAEYVAVARVQADALVASDPDLAAMATGLVALAPLSALFADRSPPVPIASGRGDPSLSRPRWSERRGGSLALAPRVRGRLTPETQIPARGKCLPCHLPDLGATSPHLPPGHQQGSPQ